MPYDGQQQKAILDEDVCRFVDFVLSRYTLFIKFSHSMLLSDKLSRTLMDARKNILFFEIGRLSGFGFLVSRAFE